MIYFRIVRNSSMECFPFQSIVKLKCLVINLSTCPIMYEKKDGFFFSGLGCYRFPGNLSLWNRFLIYFTGFFSKKFSRKLFQVLLLYKEFLCEELITGEFD
jgi:hypothetical protein